MAIAMATCSCETLEIPALKTILTDQPAFAGFGIAIALQSAGREMP
jgi:hypothetical protein